MCEVQVEWSSCIGGGTWLLGEAREKEKGKKKRKERKEGKRKKIKEKKRKKKMVDALGLGL